MRSKRNHLAAGFTLSGIESPSSVDTKRFNSYSRFMRASRNSRPVHGEPVVIHGATLLAIASKALQNLLARAT